MSIRNVAKAIILHDGKVLLNKCVGYHGEVYFDLPGGGQNQYETMEEALVRECLEETGFTICPLRFAALTEVIYDDLRLRKQYVDYSHRLYHIFIAKLTDRTPVSPSETDFQQQESQWIKIVDASSLDVRPYAMKGNFEKIINAQAPVYFGSMHVSRAPEYLR